jgi:hypothetical protein
MFNPFQSFLSANGSCSGKVTHANGLIHVDGRCSVPGTELSFIAAAPADARSSSMGSGLPFGNPHIAYEGTVNRGTVPVVNGRFQLSLVPPNSYYVKNGSLLISPHVHITIGNEYFNIPFGNHTPNRSLSSLPGMPNRSTRR